MAFGIDSGISRDTAYSVQTADKVGTQGEVEEITTYGADKQETVEFYEDADYANAAVNGQIGNTTTGVVTSQNIVESNTDYCRVRQTTRTPLAAATTTTTTTTTTT